MSVLYLWPECKGKTVVVLMLNQETLQYVFVPKVKVAQSCLTFCDPMDCSMPGFPVPHYLSELAQTHAH